eukprot:4632348-Pleurochrysis_carterae.AAC.1
MHALRNVLAMKGIPANLRLLQQLRLYVRFSSLHAASTLYVGCICLETCSYAKKKDTESALTMVRPLLSAQAKTRRTSA